MVNIMDKATRDKVLPVQGARNKTPGAGNKEQGGQRQWATSGIN